MPKEVKQNIIIVLVVGFFLLIGGIALVLTTPMEPEPQTMRNNPGVCVHTCQSHNMLVESWNPNRGGCTCTQQTIRIVSSENE